MAEVSPSIHATAITLWLRTWKRKPVPPTTYEEWLEGQCDLLTTALRAYAEWEQADLEPPGSWDQPFAHAEDARAKLNAALEPVKPWLEDPNGR